MSQLFTKLIHSLVCFSIAIAGMPVLMATKAHAGEDLPTILLKTQRLLDEVEVAKTEVLQRAELEITILKESALLTSASDETQRRIQSDKVSQAKAELEGHGPAQMLQAKLTAADQNLQRYLGSLIGQNKLPAERLMLLDALKQNLSDAKELANHRQSLSDFLKELQALKTNRTEGLAENNKNRLIAMGLASLGAVYMFAVRNKWRFLGADTDRGMGFNVTFFYSAVIVFVVGGSLLADYVFPTHKIDKVTKQVEDIGAEIQQSQVKVDRQETEIRRMLLVNQLETSLQFHPR